MADDRGFTLVELLLVLLIVAIAAGLTVPNFSKTYARIQLKKTAEDLAYLMRYAQSRAVVKNRPVRLTFDEEFSRYWLTEATAEDNEEFARISGRWGKTYPVSEKIEVFSDKLFVTFYPDGHMDRQLIYVTREERTLTISTREQRGYVRVFDEKVE